MLPISAVLPGFPTPQTRAPWPVWRNSVTGAVRWVITSRKEAARRWHAARRWDRETRRPGRHGGIIGRVALDVLYVLSFDFLNYASGRLDPSHAAIAAKASCCRRSVVNALARLAALGLIAWRRRCEEGRDPEGRYCLRQRTNAYALLPPSQWRGYVDPERPIPPPSPDTLGCPEPVPDPIEAAATEIIHGQQKASLAALEVDPRDTLAAALASFGRAIEAREAQKLTGVHELPRNPTPCSNHVGDSPAAAPDPDPKPPDDDIEALKAWHLRRMTRLLGPD